MSKEGKYIYGVIGTGEKKSFGPIGIGERGDEVYTVPYQDIAAVTSDSPIIDYKSLTKDVVVRYLLAYQSAIEQVMKHHTVIPFKFAQWLGATKSSEPSWHRATPSSPMHLKRCRIR